MIRNMKALARVFQFLKVDARQSIYEQHRQIRQMFMVGHRKPWADSNEQAILSWLNSGAKTPNVEIGEEKREKQK